MSKEPARDRQSRRRPVTQPALLRELSRREPEAWDVFYANYWQWLLGVCLGWDIPYADAEDLVQTTFIRVDENIDDFHYDRSRGRFSSWLLVILGNLARDYWRRIASENKRCPMQRPSQSDRKTQQLCRVAGPPKDRVFNQVLANELRRVFEQAYAELKAQVTEQHWLVFKAYAIEGGTADEVAVRLGVAPGTVYSIACRLHGKLRPIIARKLGL